MAVSKGEWLLFLQDIPDAALVELYAAVRQSINERVVIRDILEKEETDSDPPS